MIKITPDCKILVKQNISKGTCKFYCMTHNRNHDYNKDRPMCSYNHNVVYLDTIYCCEKVEKHWNTWTCGFCKTCYNNNIVFARL